MQKLNILLFFIIIVLGGIVFSQNLQRAFFYSEEVSSPIPTAIPTATPEPTPLPHYAPVHILIPKINVDAVVESVGLDAEGRMGVPQFAQNTAWYSLGYKPGEKGSVVIDGHLDTATGQPAVFWYLSRLEPGDDINITDEVGNIFTYRVTQTVNYNYDEVPLEEVFNSSDKARLNLITCAGSYNQHAQNYNQRTVVYTELIR